MFLIELIQSFPKKSCWLKLNAIQTFNTSIVVISFSILSLKCRRSEFAPSSTKQIRDATSTKQIRDAMVKATASPKTVGLVRTFKAMIFYAIAATQPTDKEVDSFQHSSMIVQTITPDELNHICTNRNNLDT